MEKSTSDQEIQQKMETASITNENQNHAEIHQLDQEAANTSSSGNGNQHRDQLLNSIKAMAESLEPHLSSNECCIYRIPTYLRKLNEESYTPQVISIGPFHHGTKRLEPMEKLKLKYFQRFLQRMEFNVLESLVNDIKVREERVRGCYAETINLSSDDFVKLIVADGCFLIEFFYSLCSQGLKSVILENHILLNPISWKLIMLDLQLLENQLPFFALEIIFSFVDVHSSIHDFTSLAIMVFKSQMEFLRNLGRQPNIRHFVELTKAFLFPSSGRLPLLLDESNDLPSADHLYSASQLYEAGVKFKVSSSKCLLDLKFTNGTLEIPRINLYQHTETIYRNVIAFEQCHYPYDLDLSDYIMLLNFLTNTTKDVDLLIREGIIINWLPNSNSVASFINHLGTNTVYSGRTSAHRGLFRDLNAFYRNPKHTWKATLKRDYLGTPWKIVSTAAAVTLLLLTLGQFICSIIQLVKM